MSAVERIGHARNGELVGASGAPGLRFSAGPARLPGPDAVSADAREQSGRDADNDRMRLRQDVIFSCRAPGVFAFANDRVATGTPVALVTGVAQGLRRPAEATLLIAPARRRRAAVGRRGIPAVGIIERAFGTPDDVGRQRAGRVAAHRVERGLMQCERSAGLKEAKRAFDFPDQIAGMTRSGGQTGEQRYGPSGRARLSTHTPLPDPIRGYTSAPPRPRARKVPARWAIRIEPLGPQLSH